MLPSEKDSRQNQDLVIQSVRELMGGKYVDPEKFAKEPTSAEAEALRLLDFNTGKFAQNYVKEQKDPDPRIVEAMGVQKEKKEKTDMPQMQEGGMVNMQNGGILGGDLPPEAIANGNVIQGAPVGEVAVPGGGGPVDDGVPTQLPEGTFVLNAASVEYHGTKHINDLIKTSIRNLIKKGVQITGEDLNPDDDVPVAISNGEYIIPPEVSRDIGIKKLEDMNERGLEYRKKVEEQEKQKVAAQDEAMNSFVSAPIQSEQQMPMQDGGEATPPDEAMPKPPEDTSDLNEGQKAVIEAEMLKRRLQQEFFNRESERQRRLMEEDERNRGMIFNPKTNNYDLMVQAQPTPTPFVDTLRKINPDNLDKPRRIMGDPNNPSVPVRQAAIGGQILPQVQSTLAGAGIGANAYPSSPQETFLNTPITGSVLQNLGNAVPFSTMQQPQQQVGFMQPMDQKKNPEIARFSFANGDKVTYTPLEERIESYEITEKNKTEDGNYIVYEDEHRDQYGNLDPIKTVGGVNLRNLRNTINNLPKDLQKDVIAAKLDREQQVGNVIPSNLVRRLHKYNVNLSQQQAEKTGVKNPQALDVLTDLYYNFKKEFKNAHAALLAGSFKEAARQLKYTNPDKSEAFTRYFFPKNNKTFNKRAEYNIDTLNSIKQNVFPIPKLKPKPSKGFIDKIQNVLGRK